MSEKLQTEVPGIAESDLPELEAGTRADIAGSNLDPFVQGVMDAAEFFRRQREGKSVDKGS